MTRTENHLASTTGERADQLVDKSQTVSTSKQLQLEMMLIRTYLQNQLDTHSLGIERLF